MKINNKNIGGERIASALGTVNDLGLLCEQSGIPEPEVINRMNQKVIDAGEALNAIYDAFGKDLVLGQPLFYGREVEFICGDHDPDKYAAFWYHPDHLGSSSYITNLSGEINQHMEYLPFGELLVEEHLNSYNSPFKFNAKEFDAETGNYYYGARYYDPKWSLWLSVDPLFSKYPTLSPYIYTANNPIVFIDPDGMQIEPGSQTEWDKQKQNVAIEHAAAGVMFAFTGRQGERYGSLSETMDVLNCLENSSQVYSLNSGALDSEVTYDPNTGNIVISYNGTSLFVHETTHAGQFETGDIAFSSSGAVLAQDVYDEVAAYKAQYAYNPASVSSLPSSSEVNSMSDITPAWVQGIKAPNGDQPYKLGGTTNTGVSPVNVNSTRDQLIKAYPHLKSGLQALPANATLKSEIPTMYYKN